MATGGQSRGGVAEHRSTSPLLPWREAVRDVSCMESPTSRDSRLDWGGTGTARVKSASEGGLLC